MSTATYWRIVWRPRLSRAALATRLRRGLVRLQLIRDTRHVHSRLMAANERGLFIDCGSNLGQGFLYFRRHFPPQLFDYMLMEPNPHCACRLRQAFADCPDRIEIVEAAASDREGEASLYGLAEDRGGPLSQGGSILREHNSAWHATPDTTPTTVRTVSLSSVIADKHRQYPVIVMKMDIEGGEYAVLEDLAATGTHRHVSHMYVEFHSQYMREPDRATYRTREGAIRRRFRADQVPMRIWV